MSKKLSTKREIWPIERIEKGLELFYNEHGHYPTATQFEDYLHLPSAKTIERKFGGLVEFRKLLNLKGQSDFREGKHSSQRAVKINKRSHEMEKKVYDFLVDLFGIEFVHREHFFTDDRRTRTDFFIFYDSGNFSVDVFYPSDRRNFYGCLNHKIKKYKDSLMLQYPVIFLQMNENMSQEYVDDMLKKRKGKLVGDMRVMCFDTFKEFSKPHKPRK